MEDYPSRQKVRDQEYQREYSIWIKGMSPEKRMMMKAKGVDQVLYVRDGFGSPEILENKEDESSSFDPSTLDTLGDIWAEETIGMTQEVAAHYCAEKCHKIIARAVEFENSRTFSKIIGGFIEGSLSLPKVYGLAFAGGLNEAMGWSMSSIAKKIGVTRASISKWTVWWSKKLDLGASRYMKSIDSRESYSEVQKKYHWRKPWAKTSKI